MQPKITFTGTTPTDQTNTGEASVTITRNPDGSATFETVTASAPINFTEKNDSDETDTKK